MNPKVRIEQTETVPDDATIRHYDELDSSAKQQFPGFVADSREEWLVDHETAHEFTDGEFVKFTKYYRVLVA